MKEKKRPASGGKSAVGLEAEREACRDVPPVGAVRDAEVPVRSRLDELHRSGADHVASLEGAPPGRLDVEAVAPEPQLPSDERGHGEYVFADQVVLQGSGQGMSAHLELIASL